MTTKKYHKLFVKLTAVCMLGLLVAGCAQEGFKRFIMLPAAVERQDREREEKANSLVIPPKWHKTPSQQELEKKPTTVSDAPLYTKENIRNPEAVEPNYKKEREDEAADQRTPDLVN